MSNSLALVLVAVAAIVGPLLLSALNNRQRRREKVDDYKRQDAVAEQAAEAAALLSERQDAAARATARVAENLEATTQATTQRLEGLRGDVAVVHTLVNSEMTDALHAVLLSTKTTLALQRQVLILHEQAGRQPSSVDLAEIRATEAEVARMEENLAVRAEQTALAEQQIREQAPR